MISDQHLPWEILCALLQQSGIYHLYAVLHIIIPSLTLAGKNVVADENLGDGATF